MPDPIAVTLAEATRLVPFSKDFLYKATKRTSGNVLPARLAARKTVVLVSDLTAWVRHEGEDAA